MRSLLLGLLVVVGFLAVPASAVAGPGQQQAPEEYQARLMLWQQLAEREVGLAAQLIDDDARWANGSVRADAAARLADVIEIARRPPRAFEALYRLRVQPVNEWLDALASAVRVGRREEAVLALDALRPQLLDSDAALAAGPYPRAGALQAPPSSAEAYANAAVERAVATCAANALQLGWRPDWPMGADEFVRAYWLDWLAAVGVEPLQLAAAATEDCSALYARAERVAADRGFDLAQRQGWVEPDTTRLPTAAAGMLSLRQYRSMVAVVKRDLPQSMQCFFRVSRALDQPTAGRFILGTACENVIIDHPGCLTTARSTGLPGFMRCLVGLWQEAYGRALDWTPPAQYNDFHVRLLASLTALNLAADYTIRALPTTGGQATPISVARAVDARRNARALVLSGEEQCKEAFTLYDGSTCEVDQ